MLVQVVVLKSLLLLVYVEQLRHLTCLLFANVSFD